MSPQNRHPSSRSGGTYAEFVRYYRLGGLTILRAIDVDYARLDKRTGAWVRDNSLIGPITGMDGSANCNEITLQDAQAWVAKNCPGISPKWL